MGAAWRFPTYPMMPHMSQGSSSRLRPPSADRRRAARRGQPRQLRYKLVGISPRFTRTCCHAHSRKRWDVKRLRPHRPGARVVPKRPPMDQRATPASAPVPVHVPPLAPRVLLAHGREWRSRSRELERALRPAGYTVLEAFTGPDALQQARRSQPDAIILDTALPDGDASGLCRALRVDPDITASTPIFVTTAGPTTRQQVSDALRAGANSVWADPDRKSTRLNSSHLVISYAVFCLKKKKKKAPGLCTTRT